jgi:hypothetical protein
VLALKLIATIGKLENDEISWIVAPRQPAAAIVPTRHFTHTHTSLSISLVYLHF